MRLGEHMAYLQANERKLTWARYLTKSKDFSFEGLRLKKHNYQSSTMYSMFVAMASMFSNTNDSQLHARARSMEAEDDHVQSAADVRRTIAMFPDL